jgi:hypothetical protein
MLLEFISHAVALDLGWIVGFIASNLHWLFALVATTFIFYDGKKVLMPFILTVGMLWASADFALVSGWVWAVPAFLFIHYITRFAVMTFCSEVDRLKNILPVVFIIQFFAVYIIFNLFLK